MLQAYRQQYGFAGIHLLPVNLCGPHDDFDPQTSRVIPALIRKCVDARDAGAVQVDVRGVGMDTREFLHVGGCAEGIVLAAERCDGPEPVHLGTGREITIAGLAEKIRGLCGFPGVLRFDTGQPEGQPRRCLDTTRARERFGFQAVVGLDEGPRGTVAWWESHRPGAVARCGAQLWQTWFHSPNGSSELTITLPRSCRPLDA